jgi:hypothetical protein
VQAAAFPYLYHKIKEKSMQNKKLIFILSGLVLVVGAAAFVAGRMLNSNVNPLGFIGLGGKGDVMTVSIKMIPAEELPKTQPEVTGPFVERKDNTIVVASIPMKSGGGGGMVVGPGSRVDVDSIPKVEVVITNETTIYRETTEFKEPSSSETQTVQQTVEESKLDELNSQSMVMVWGRKSGDRIIAEVLFYSNPVMFKRPAP